jgi:hypothetical protein
MPSSPGEFSARPFERLRMQFGRGTGFGARYEIGMASMLLGFAASRLMKTETEAREVM